VQRSQFAVNRRHAASDRSDRGAAACAATSTTSTSSASAAAAWAGIAEVLLNLGYHGAAAPTCKAQRDRRRLRGLGARVHIGHDGRRTSPARDVVVVSSAVRERQPRGGWPRARRGCRSCRAPRCWPS
jgi:hypothetical protein